MQKTLLSREGHRTSSRDAWLRQRKSAQDSLYVFSHQVLGFKDLYAPLHSTMCDLWSSPIQNKVAIYPRDHLKSSMFSIAGPLYDMIKDLPDAPIFPPPVPLQCLLGGENEKIPVPFLAAIRWHIEANPVFRKLFPEIRPGTPWQSTRINVQRAFDPVLRQNTIEIMGGHGNPTSPHYNLIVCDDLVGFTNYDSREGREKAYEWYRATSPLLLPGGRRLITGTRWHEDDVLGRILSDNPNMPVSKAYKVEMRGCYDAEGNSIFPTRWPKDRLEAERISIGEEMFALWYLNDPLDPSAAAFKPHWLTYWETDVLPGQLGELETAIIVDPAATVSQSSDYTGIIVASAHGENRYIMRADQLKVTWPQIIEEVRRLSRIYSAQYLGVEVYGPGAAILGFFEAEYKKGGIPRPQKLAVYAQAGSKNQRIRGLAPYLEYGNIKVHRSQRELIHQILHFPKTVHDHLIDALSYLPELLPFGIGWTEQKKEEQREHFDMKDGDFLVKPIEDETAPVPTWGWL